MKIFNTYINTYRLDPATIAYMGDDMPDIEVMKRCAVAACPADAAADVQQISNYTAAKNGGHGAVRELVEAVMKLQKTWY